MYPYGELQDQTEKLERDIIIEKFCKTLTISSVVQGDLSNHDLPDGYSVGYFRQCHRTEYDINPNILVISNEKEIINDEIDVVEQNKTKVRL